MTVTGLYNPRQQLPLVPLSDGAGDVVAIGEGVTQVNVGDRVTSTFFQNWTGRRVPEIRDAFRTWRAAAGNVGAVRPAFGKTA